MCPLCGRRRAKRACPALGHAICPVCCGTKRRSEIPCPDDCVYLRTSQSHPPAAVQRQRERDLQFLLPLLQGLSESQQRATLLLQDFLRHQRPDAPALGDDDVAQASRALAETYETASRGIIYEHAAGLASAERLSADLKSVVEARRSEGLTLSDAELAAVLRRIETGARNARSALGGGRIAYLELLRRVFEDASASVEDPMAPDAESESMSGTSGLIIP